MIMCYVVGASAEKVDEKFVRISTYRLKPLLYYGFETFL